MSTNTLTIVARILAKAEQRELVKSELLKLIAPTRAEEGCINYDLHQDRANPNLFIFYENWISHDFLQKHMASAHIAEYRNATEGALESFALYEMTQIG